MFNFFYYTYFYYTYNAYEQESFLPDFISAPIESLAITGGKYQKEFRILFKKCYKKDLLFSFLRCIESDINEALRYSLKERAKKKKQL